MQFKDFHHLLFKKLNPLPQGCSPSQLRSQNYCISFLLDIQGDKHNTHYIQHSILKLAHQKNSLYSKFSFFKLHTLTYHLSNDFGLIA